MILETLTFGCETTVYVGPLYVRSAYYGLLEGQYTDEVNQMMLEANLEAVDRIFGAYRLPINYETWTRRAAVGLKLLLGFQVPFSQPTPVHRYLIDPILVEHGPFHRLPNFCCMAELISSQPAHDPTRMLSSVVLVWFQECKSPIVGDFVQESAQKLNWVDIAEDGDW